MSPSSMEPYADIRPNEALCEEFSRQMRLSDKQYLCDLRSRYYCSFGTDMGTYKWACRSFCGLCCLTDLCV